MSLLVPVILSGGAGTRLWPVSRSAYPKPFMRMADGQSLLYKTLDRALRVAGDGPVLTVTGRDYYFLTRDEYARHPASNPQRQPFLLEPVGRNTAPAIGLAAMYTMEHLGAEATLLVLPADHLIRDADAFAAAARRAQTLAQDGFLVTFGIKPAAPETGFGYIRMGAARAQGGREIAAFVEKPDRATAEKYLASGDYAWNSGMFCFRADALLEAMQATCPDVLDAVRACYADVRGRESPVEFAKDAFAALPDISIDYAVMERAARRAVVPASFDWSDIGSWKAVSEIESGNAPDAAGNRVQGMAVTIDCENCFIQGGKRLIAAVGVKDLVIVDTADAVLVADRERAQQVKQVVEQLRASDHAAARFHQTVHRPWGSFTVLEDEADCKVKRLTVKPGQVLSLQLHHRRSEHWTVVDGTARVRVGDKEFLLQRNESTFIPMETLHRLENPTGKDIHLIEVQCGDYFGEDDIVRLEDVYGRV
ncbi:MAG: mannose-1-phosphate guanylyltransferase/mannose-6-phosphate isomerase [Xanthomonadaceae bacterium]|nr:mannose-1-phosphate guanylyltransferase/mannose-6-phosphate isomerase [Xanthomonadaceae bacterium]MDE2257933.1 mannose-1-phosphate guanylyltransferase/mannose-6-phosphate isomerase [Xanthomonadaceae bacterium]